MTEQDIERAIEELGIQGARVCIHSSLKSFRDKPEKGCETILNGFRTQNCTVMVPSFTYGYTVKPAAGQMPKQNGCNYDRLMKELPDRTGIYTSRTNRVSIKDMGIFTAYVVNREGRVRGNHPINSFTAVGPEAEILIRGQTPENVYEPFAEMYRAGGYALLMGTGLCRLTAIHYAEQLAGRSLFVRWALGMDGRVIPVRGGGCSAGFENFSRYLEPVLRKTSVGGSEWKCFEIRRLIDICVEVISKCPEITHCGQADCELCRDAIKGGPVKGYF